MRSGKELIRELCNRIAPDLREEFELVFAQLDAARGNIDSDGNIRARKVDAAGGEVVIDDSGLRIDTTDRSTTLTLADGKEESYIYLISDGQQMAFAVEVDAALGTPLFFWVLPYAPSSTSTVMTLANESDQTRLRLRAPFLGDGAYIELPEGTVTPTAELTAGDGVQFYTKADKMVWRYKDAGGTYRYFYFDLTATADQQIIYSATAP